MAFHRHEPYERHEPHVFGAERHNDVGQIRQMCILETARSDCGFRLSVGLNAFRGTKLPLTLVNFRLFLATQACCLERDALVFFHHITAS